MFNTTHTLAGLALARTGLDRSAPYATWTAVIASNLPDIDIVFAFASTASYLDHHRGLSHSIVGLPVLALALSAIMYAISRAQGKAFAPFRNHFAVALVAMITHPLLDFANSYGVRPFLPFSQSWSYGDTLFIIDPYLDLILLAGVIAAIRWPGRKAIIVAVSLLLTVSYVVIRVELRNMASAQVERHKLSMSGLLRYAVLPQMLNPFVWTGILETEKAISNVTVDVLSGRIDQESSIARPEPSPVIAAAQETYAGSVFRGFARFPTATVEESPQGYHVLLIDYRFYRRSTGVALAAEITLDQALRVQSEAMSFTHPLPASGDN